MPERKPLQPTLWRTCRVLANHARLDLLALLIDEPGQRVTSAAVRLHLSIPGTSLNLRALEARGLLQARRSGKYVEYRFGSDSEPGPMQELLKALRLQLRHGTGARDSIFRAVTAFTHPRRIELFREIHAGGKNSTQLKQATRISLRALARHAAKLESRGIIQRHDDGRYVVKAATQAVERALIRLALG